ncbi:hypothetical protein BOTBODRAFT_576551 [Botryobasidium botryosum FD-172 SS1]|uniref:Arf-GAP domain-containing protein n=1 Tax=Botryobasidium botryosum (strain FD-172 SS1) TaxID=930990 RepID=A0A067N034_BOTB1|nr:hypothetical protein BOTBODRAFT_576551 [Botryobasidium botryosum FD-172 SS1]
MSRQDKSTTERHTRTLRELVKKPENKTCADCKRNDPRWASWNLGVFVCIRCSGIHRSMGTHISKVKSVDLDVWTPEQMASIQKWGNHRANLYWEAHLKAGHVPPDHKMDSFIRSKYESRRWAMEGPPPSDPAVLEEGQGQSSETPAPQQTEAPPSRTQTPTGSGSRAAVSHSTANASRPPHALLSTARARSGVQATLSHSTTPEPPQAAPAPQPAQADLFSLDFHAPPPTQQQFTNTSTATTQADQPKKDPKADILSLFASSTTTTAAAPVQPSVTSMMGQSGAGMWGVQSGWAAPAQSGVSAGGDPWGSFSSATQQAPNPLFQTQNVWSTPAAAAPAPAPFSNVWASSSTNTTTTAGSGDLFSTPFSATGTTSAKKDDAFGDLWGDFK